MDRGINDKEEDRPSVADAATKLKAIARYAMIAFAPVMSVVALLVAFSNNQSQSDRTQLSELASRIDSLNASQSETKGELDNLKFAVAREKTLRGEEHKKADEHDAKIVQNVTRLQTKLKVSPTLEEQLREVASTPLATPPVAIAASAPSVVTTSAVPNNKQIAVAPVPKLTDKKPVSAAPATSDAAKTHAQAKDLKSEIERFNKK